jgi:carbon starvation protein CstA
MQRREGSFLQAPILPSQFWLPLLPCHFCPFISKTFSWHLLLLKQKKTKQNKEKKNHKEEKNAKKGRSFPSSSHSALSFLGLAFALPLLPLCFKRFLLASFSSQAEEKKRKQRQKNHREKKNAKKGGSFNFLQAPTLPFHFWLLLLPSHFYPSVSNTFSWHLFLLKQKKRKKNKKKKTIEKINAKKGGSFPSSSCIALSFLAPASTLSLMPFYFKFFLLASSSSQTKEKKREKKMQRREGTYL